MEGQIDAANNFLKTDEGKKVAQSFGENNPTGDPQTENPSFDAQGNQGAPGQFAPKDQYGAVTGGGLGGALGGQDQPPQQQDKGKYEGYDQNDSTGEGGWGKNAGGGAFSRSNQLGADNNQNAHDDHVHEHENEGGYKTGYSTPGYRRENEDEEEKARQQNRNVYGQQADDRGATGNDLNEAEI